MPVEGEDLDPPSGRQPTPSASGAIDSRKEQVLGRVEVDGSGRRRSSTSRAPAARGEPRVGRARSPPNAKGIRRAGEQEGIRPAAVAVPDQDDRRGRRPRRRAAQRVDLLGRDLREVGRQDEEARLRSRAPTRASCERAVQACAPLGDGRSHRPPAATRRTSGSGRHDDDSAIDGASGRRGHGPAGAAARRGRGAPPGRAPRRAATSRLRATDGHDRTRSSAVLAAPAAVAGSSRGEPRPRRRRRSSSCR